MSNTPNCSRTKLRDGSTAQDDHADGPAINAEVTGTVAADALQEFVDARVQAKLDEMDVDDGSTDNDGAITDDPRANELLQKVERLFEELDPEEIQMLLTRLEEGLDLFEETMGLKAQVGPSLPGDGYAHSTPGWGMVFECDGPLDLGECDVYPTQPGMTVAELHKYDGDGAGLVDSTNLSFATKGEQSVDLDLRVPEAGTYILTRDYHALDNGELPADERVSMWRTHDDWDGWGEVGNGIMTLKTSAAANPDFGGEPALWYYFFDISVQAVGPSEG